MPSWVQFSLYALVVIGPILIKVIAAISKGVNEHAERRRREIDRERAELEGLRTGGFRAHRQR